MTAKAFGLLLLAISLFAAGRLAAWDLLQQFAFAILALLLVSFFLSRSAGWGLSLSRVAAPSHAEVGSQVVDTLTLRNETNVGKLWVEVRDASELPGHDASCILSPGRKQEESWTSGSLCVRRGVFRMGPAFLRTGDPLSLFTRSERVDLEEEVLVFPPVFQLPNLQLSRADSMGGAFIDRRSTQSSPAVASVREYQSGDALNRVAWSVSARTGKLMVKEFDLDPTSEIWIIADFESSTRVFPQAISSSRRSPDLSLAEIWMDSTEEYVVALAASVAQLGFDRRRATGLMSTTSPMRIHSPDQSERQRRHILEELALATSTGQESIADVIVRESARFDRVRTPVVVTASTDPRWVRALDSLTLRGVEPIAIFVDPFSFDLTTDSTAVRSELAHQHFFGHVVDFTQGIESSFAQISTGEIDSWHLRSQQAVLS